MRQKREGKRGWLEEWWHWLLNRKAFCSQKSFAILAVPLRTLGKLPNYSGPEFHHLFNAVVLNWVKFHPQPRRDI
jgi:hypothetical protein